MGVPYSFHRFTNYEDRWLSLESAAQPKASDELSPAQRRIHDAIADYQAGRDSERAFQVVFDAYYGPIRRFFGRKGFSPQDSLDLTQETFVGIAKGLKTYRREARLETWLFTIATTTFLKRLRTRATAKRRGQEVEPDDVGADPALAVRGDQLDRVLDVEYRRALRRAVRELPEQMRQCLTLRIYQDLKYREIAAIMQLSIETVKVHLFQARKRLRERLGGAAAMGGG